MKLSLNLLKTFIDFKETPEQLAEILTERAFEVEEIIERKPRFTKVLSAKVTKIEKHPDADKLRIISLDTGLNQISPVICGAYNFSVGDIVALAQPGSLIPQNIHSDKHEGFTLEKAKIRGIVSEGMICAKFELGFSNDPNEEGIWILEPNTSIGEDVSKLVSTDVIFDVALPANRPDLHSHWGAAQEISAVLGIPTIVRPDFEHELKTGNLDSISVITEKECSKIISVKVDDVQIKPSPDFISKTLISLGIKPINNIVDITNFVMFELGQPMHAFDFQTLHGDLKVRYAKNGEELHALNNLTYKLESSTVVIADDEKALDIAGIIGGRDSGVTSKTDSILLTAANFDPKYIRITSNKIGVRTEASALFQNGISPLLVEKSIHRALYLIQKYAGGTVSKTSSFGNTKIKQINVSFTPHDINKLIGTNYTSAEIVTNLERWGIKTTEQANNLAAEIPWWRSDITDTADLAEELIKSVGINTITPQPLIISTENVETSLSQSEHYLNIKQWWARSGFNEVKNYGFVSEQDILKAEQSTENLIEIANPLSMDQQYMKRSMLIPLLKNVSLNSKNFDEFKLIEIGYRYKSFGNEVPTLSGIAYSKDNNESQLLYNEIHGYIVEFLKSLNITNYQWTIDKLTTSAELQINKDKIGTLSLITPKILKNFGINGSVVWFQFSLQKLIDKISTIRFHPFTKYPKIYRDISFDIPKDTDWFNIEPVFSEASELLIDNRIFDANYIVTNNNKEFHEKLDAEGLKNFGVRLTFMSPERTLKDSEINGIMDKIMLELKQKFNANIR